MTVLVENITHFDINLVINEDTTVDVTETITYDFDDLWQKLDIKSPVVVMANGATRKKLDIYKSELVDVSDELFKDKILIESLKEKVHRFAINYYEQL